MRNGARETGTAEQLRMFNVLGTLPDVVEALSGEFCAERDAWVPVSGTR